MHSPMLNSLDVVSHGFCVAWQVLYPSWDYTNVMSQTLISFLVRGWDVKDILWSLSLTWCKKGTRRSVSSPITTAGRFLADFMGKSASPHYCMVFICDSFILTVNWSRNLCLFPTLVRELSYFVVNVISPVNCTTIPCLLLFLLMCAVSFVDRSSDYPSKMTIACCPKCFFT